MITKWMILNVLLLGFSFCSKAQQMVEIIYDVDSLLIGKFYSTENKNDSVIYVKENGEVIKPYFTIPSRKWKGDSVAKYETRRFMEKSRDDEVHYTVFAYILFEKFKIKEIRIRAGWGTQKPQYDLFVKEVFKEMEDIWILPSYNDHIPILTLMPFTCSSHVLYNKGIELIFDLDSVRSE